MSVSVDDGLVVINMTVYKPGWVNVVDGCSKLEEAPLPKSQLFWDAFVEVLLKFTINGEQPEETSELKEDTTFWEYKLLTITIMVNRK